MTVRSYHLKPVQSCKKPVPVRRILMRLIPPMKRLVVLNTYRLIIHTDIFQFYWLSWLSAKLWE